MLTDLYDEATNTFRTALARWTVTDIPVASTVDGQYALWGRRVDPLATGWCRAVEGRLKWVDLPLDPPVMARAAPPPHMVAALRACGWEP